MGVPVVTLRSWETRYGIGSGHRTAGGHRRYERDGVERLQRMRNLIAAGTTAREAARLSAMATPVGDDRSAPDVWTARESRDLVDRASAFDVAALTDQLDACLAVRGLRVAWEQVIGPALQELGTRQQALHDCTDIELLLTQTSSEAIDRYADRRRRSHGARLARPILLVCCPGERHHLPLKVLHGVLLEQGVPAVVLGPGLPADAVTAAIERAAPPVVVLWSMVRRPGIMAFYDDVAARHDIVTYAVGPGWPRAADPITVLADAVDRIGEAWLATSTAPRRSGR